jgi:glycosyltransferase involved in cell wall biosynthesis
MSIIEKNHSYKITVVVPVYNGEKFIKHQLNVIQDQEIENIEVIFVDNNSKDGSIVKIKQEISSGKWNMDIKLAYQSVQGCGAARNRGLELAKGEFISFLDVDDKILPGYWTNCLDIFKNDRSLSYIFCKTLRIYSDGRELLHDHSRFKPGLNQPPVIGFELSTNFFATPNSSPYLIRTEIAKSLVGFREELYIGEDTDFFSRLGYLHKGYFLDQVFYHYYKYENSITGERNKLRKATLDYFQIRKTYLIPFYEENKENDLVSTIYLSQILGLIDIWKEGSMKKNQVIEELKNIKQSLIPPVLLIPLFKLTSNISNNRWNPLHTFVRRSGRKLRKKVFNQIN